MRGRDRPLAVALGIALLAGAAGVGVAVSKHRSLHPPLRGTDVVSVNSTYSGGLVTLSPDTPTPYPQQPIPAAAGVDLLWRSIPGDDMMLEAVDWSGVVRGRLALPAPAGQLGITASPDGQEILVQRDGGYEVLGAQGQYLGALSGSGYSWADDSRHLCSLAFNTDRTSTAQLFYGAPGEKDRLVTTMFWQGGGGVRIAACSASKDLAVLSLDQGDDMAGHTVEYRIVRLSTGTVLRDVHPPAPDFSGRVPRSASGSVGTISASHDGRMLALEPFSGDPGTSEVIRDTLVDTLSGRVLGHVTGPVDGFSSDDRLALTWAGVVDWHTGHVVWRPRFTGGGTVATRPGGTDLLVSEPATPPTPVPTAGFNGDTTSAPPDTLYFVVHADGSLTPLGGGAFTFY